MSTPHIPVIVVGGSQAGLSVSYCLKERGIEHIVFEKKEVGATWMTERWDSFCLVTPNWQCTLPGFAYDKEYGGTDPDGFMLKDEIIRYIKAYRDHFGPPLREGVGVLSVEPEGHLFRVETEDGVYIAEHVVIATGGYHIPKIPPARDKLPAHVTQLHSSTYRNPYQVGAGAVLVIGSGQSGCQIAEDLHLAGKQVHLAVGGAPRAPRTYRGRDVTCWLVDMGHYDLSVDKHPLGEGVRKKANHYMTGRDGGREIDLRRFATEGMKLYGRLDDMDGDAVTFQDNLRQNLDNADATAERIKSEIDAWIAAHGIDAPAAEPFRPVWQPDDTPPVLSLARENIQTVVWATGFATDYRWLKLPILDENGYPAHWRGASRRVDGLYLIGLPWMYTWGSGRFSGVGRDAAYITEMIAAALNGNAKKAAAV